MVPQWRQDYLNNRPPTQATGISEMGHKQPPALQKRLQKRLGQGQTYSPDRDRLTA
jgi:hypothetical protein